MKNNLLSKKSFGLIATLLATISLLAIAATPVFAKPLSPLPVPSIKVPAANKTSYDDRLSALFAQERTSFNNLRPGADIRMTSLTDAEKVLADTEKFDAQVANFDSQQHRELSEAALAKQTNTVKMDDLRISEQVSFARSLIAAHPGFTEDGDVTNSAVALQTINTLNAYVANIRYFVNRSNTDLTNAEQAKGVLSSSLRTSSK
jgi:hypothetical protein